MLFLLEHFKRAPWTGKVSIYSYIQAQIQQGQSPDGSLPDDEDYWAGQPVRWVAGGLDGAMGHHAAAEQRREEVRELVQLLVRQTRKPENRSRKALYQALLKADIGGSMIDAILEEVRRHPGIQPQSLFEEARWLTEHAAHRKVVKLGISLLGLFQNMHMKEELLTLGRHDEFTLYAAVAIQNGMDDSNDVLFDLARQVNGWGKIHLVERLQPSSQEIRNWLLRSGCQNSIMNEYLACICARSGGLHEALAAGQVDAELFDGAGIILQALLSGGPAEDIDDYEEAPQVVADYVRLAGAMSSTVKHLSVLLNLRDFLGSDEAVWASRCSSGWTEQGRMACLEACKQLIAQPDWHSRIMDAVHSGDASVHRYGIVCAERLGIDIWEIVYGQLDATPLQSSHYYELMKSGDPDRIRKLIDFAEKKLPLQRIATGPADEMGFGREYEPHRCLGMLLQSLDAHPGMGRELIAAGLHSPVVNNRNMALKALEAWEVTSWGDRVTEALDRLAAKEPTEAVRERIRKLREAKHV